MKDTTMLITSLQNPLVKQVVALRDSKVRREQGLTLIDGKREIERAVIAGASIVRIIFCPKLMVGVLDLKIKPEMVEVSASAFEKIAFGQRTGGVMAIVKYALKDFKDINLSKSPMIVILEAVEKPGNLGAIIRTCDSAGVDALLIADPKTDIYNPNVIRASVSTVFALPVVTGTNEEILAFLKKNQIRIAAALVQARSIYTQADLKGPLAIVLGSEDKGLSEFWQKNSDVKVKIPMKGIADSLNVSVSASILIFEALRQRS